ncbi:discoidin domain-containing protein, partial [Akkermansia massiliensis]
PWRAGEAVWCGFDHGSIWPSGGRMGIVDYFRIPKRAWYWYRNEFKNIPPPEWPVEGTPAQVKLSADKKAISPADGTDDVHVTVKVADASGRQIANAVPVTLTVESGPGEFPTGKSITFTPGTDIDLIDGCAAIEFRSYYAGKTVIRAASPGLKGDSIQIISRNAPAYAAGRSAETRERPYRCFTARERDAQLARYGQSGTGAGEKANLAALRPCSASSNLQDAMKASDGDGVSAWLPSAEDREPWWRLDMEFEFRLDRVEARASGNWKGRPPVVQISRDGKIWKDVKTVLSRDGTALTAACPEGAGARYVRIRLSPGQGIAEVAVWPAEAS